jgi:kynurenine formamidase
MTRTVIVVLSVGLGACARPSATDPPAAGTWVDLTYAFDSTTIYWPTARPFHLEVVSAGYTPGGFYYATNDLSGSEHGGTHLDAPVHFVEGRHTVEAIPLERLMGPAIVIDASAGADSTPDYRVTPDDAAAWERTHGAIPAGAIVLIRTGWGRRYPDPLRYLGTAARGAGAVPQLHFPGVDSATARLLVERGVDAVGIDTPSIDYGQSSEFFTHRILGDANVPVFENVAHLDRLPATGAFVVALPMKIAGGSGGPLRIVARLP